MHRVHTSPYKIWLLQDGELSLDTHGSTAYTGYTHTLNPPMEMRVPLENHWLSNAVQAH